jgi:ubiquinone/menaquinone biosynthesis C-methylase UbiE
MILTGERMMLDRMPKETEFEHLNRYHFIKSYVKGKVVLDSACGSGYGSDILAGTAAEVDGIDISVEAIEYNKQIYHRDNLKFFTGNIEKLPFPNDYFDVVVSFETIEHVSGDIQNKFLAEIERVLKPNGILCMSTPDKYEFTDKRAQGHHSEYHVKEFYKDEFVEFLKSKFSNVQLLRQFYAMTNCILSDDRKLVQSCKAYDFEDDGMFVIAVASNSSDKQSISSEITRYPEEYETYDDYIQIFYSEDGVYSESKSQLAEYNSKKANHKISIKFDGVKCRYIRIDPMNVAGTILLHDLKIYSIDGKDIVLDHSSSNADRVKENEYTAFHRDLQMYYDLLEQYLIDHIDIDFDLKKIDLSEVIEQQIQVSENLHKELSCKETMISSMQEELSRIQEKYAEIEHTLENVRESWAYKIYRFFKRD